MADIPSLTINVAATAKVKSSFASITASQDYYRFVDYIIEVGNCPIADVSRVITEARAKVIADSTSYLNPVDDVNTAPVKTDWASRLDQNGSTGVNVSVDKNYSPNLVTIAASGVDIRADYLSGALTRVKDYIITQLGT